MSGNNTCVWVKAGNETIWDNNTVCLIGMTIDYDLKFEKHLSELYKRANSKKGAFSKLRKYLSFEKKNLHGLEHKN